MGTGDLCILVEYNRFLDRSQLSKSQVQVWSLG